MGDIINNTNLIDEGVFYKPAYAAMDFPFYIVSVSRVVAGEEYHIVHDAHESACLIYTHSGSGELTWKGQTVRFAANSIVLIHCASLHEYRTASKEEWVHTYLCFDGYGLKAYARHLLDKPHVLYPTNVALFEHGFETIQKEMLGGDSISNSRGSLLLSSFLNELLITRYASEKRSSFEGLQPAFNHIHVHYSKPIAIETLSELCHLSKYHFIRQFKRKVGQPPYQYILQCRIEHAKYLLEETRRPIERIAEMVGFHNHHNFSAQFKRQTGSTPLQYRKRK